MKKKIFLKLLCCLALALAVLCGCALAEEAELPGETQSAELQLFTSGGMPQMRRMRSVMPPGLADYVAEQLRAQSEKIKVLEYAIRPEDLPYFISDIINDNPDLFYVGPDLKYSEGATSGNVHSFYPTYIFTGDDLKKRITAFEKSVNDIAAHARSLSSGDIGRMMAVNDYFCTNYKYDDTLSIYRPDQIFTGGTGVCQAYMLAYAAVLDELGIDNTHATSYAMNHTWNVVELNGSWYHVDVTWNDPDQSDFVTSYQYFLLSDTGMENSKHYGWTSSRAASDTSYDAMFWRRVHDPLSNTKLISFDSGSLKKRLLLPGSITAVGEEAFLGSSAWWVQIPDGVKTIGARAFAGCGKLQLVEIPESVINIDATAFADSPNVILAAVSGGKVESFARQAGIPFVTLH